MRATILLSAALLLISPAFAAPFAAPQDVHGVDANLEGAAQSPPASTAPCTKERRSWVPFWRRQTTTTIIGADDCSFQIGGGYTRIFGGSHN
ncbi:MAG: hypothetical protein Q9161_006570 [Pseudevernia consocians]